MPRRASAASASAAAIGWPPTCRTSPRLPSACWPPPRSARSGRAARRSSARARWSTDGARSSRRCCSPSTATATATRAVDRSVRGGRDPGGASEPAPHRRAALPRPSGRRSPTPCTWDELRAEPAELALRAGALRPPAVRALLLGHHRTAEADRPRPRRDPARAPQDPRAAPRPRRRRSVLLVQHDRLDDVELPGLRAGRGRHDRALRRCACPPGPGRAVAARGGGGRHLLRHLGSVPAGLPQGGTAAERADRPVAHSRHRLHRRAAAGRGLPLRLRRDLPERSTSRACRAAPTCARPSSAHRRWCRCGRARSAAATSAARSRRTRRTVGPWSASRESW